MASSTVYTPEFTDIDYTAPAVTATATERCNVFYPEAGPAGWSAYGWANRYPTLLWFVNSGFTSGTPDTEIPPTSFLHPILERGIVVISASTTQCLDVASGGPTGAGTFRPPYLAGGGSSYDQWDDGTYPNPAKSAVHLIQWARENAVTYGLDPNAIAAGGRSGGSFSAMFIGHGINWSTFTGASGQFRTGIDTRPNAVVALQLLSFWDAYVDSKPIALLPDSTEPLTKVAATKGNALAVIVRESSPIVLAFNEFRYPGVTAVTGSTPAYLMATAAVGSTNLAVDGNGVPTLQDQLTETHDGWNVAMYWNRLRNLNSTFHTGNSRVAWLTSVAPPESLAPGRLLFDDVNSMFVDVADWLIGALGLPDVNVAASTVPIKAVGSKLSLFQTGDVLGIQHGGTGATTAADALSALGGASAFKFLNPYEDLTSNLFQADRDRTYVKNLTEDIVLEPQNPVAGAEVTFVFTRPFDVTLPAGTEVFGQYDNKNTGVRNVIRFKVLEPTEPKYQAWINNFYVKNTGLVFRQVTGTYFADEAAALDTPSGTPESASAFSVLKDLESYRDYNTGLFHFRYVVSSGGSVREWWFYQASNPLDTYETVEGYELDQLINSFGSTGLGGLSRAAYSGIVLDGQPNVAPNFGVSPVQGIFGAIGVLSVASSFLTLPGDPSVTAADYVELYVI